MDLDGDNDDINSLLDQPYYRSADDYSTGRAQVSAVRHTGKQATALHSFLIDWKLSLSRTGTVAGFGRASKATPSR